jgi:hypothetical protein
LGLVVLRRRQTELNIPAISEETEGQEVALIDILTVRRKRIDLVG